MECEICSTKSTWGEMWEQILDTAAEVTVADIAEIVREKRDLLKRVPEAVLLPDGTPFCYGFKLLFGVAVFIILDKIISRKYIKHIDMVGKKEV